MKEEISIRTYRPEDLPALVDLINAADAHDGMERATTREETEHDMSWPDYFPLTDCFLAWHGETLVGYADLLFAVGQAGLTNTSHTYGVVLPEWRRRGIGRRLMERLWQRTLERLPEVKGGPVYFQGQGHDVEADRRALFESLGMTPVRHYVNLARPINGELPPLDLPPGYRIRPFVPERDLETVWQVDTQAFADHWNFDGFPFDAFCHCAQVPHFRPELWLLAEEEATGAVVGLGLNRIDPDWIARTGRQEGCVNTLGVLREHRGRGLGTALLAASLHALRQEGMEAAHLHADSENLTGAMRLYERLGFRVRKTNVAYRKVIREA